LREWAAEIGGRLACSGDVYCYFDNDESGHAFHDALRLRSMIQSAS
jgi:uncharacterized protein YecE (DUF72 family)